MFFENFYCYLNFMFYVAFITKKKRKKKETNMFSYFSYSPCFLEYKTILKNRNQHIKCPFSVLKISKNTISVFFENYYYFLNFVFYMAFITKKKKEPNGVFLFFLYSLFFRI